MLIYWERGTVGNTVSWGNKIQLEKKIIQNAFFTPPQVRRFTTSSLLLSSKKNCHFMDSSDAILQEGEWFFQSD